MSVPEASRCPTVNQVAFCTISALAVGTVASVIAAATAASTIAMVAYAILGITGGAISIASITAWFDRTSTSPKAYFSNCAKQAGYTIAGFYQLVAQTLLLNLIRGIGEGISTGIRRIIAGDDVTVRVRG